MQPVRCKACALGAETRQEPDTANCLFHGAAYSTSLARGGVSPLIERSYCPVHSQDHSKYQKFVDFRLNIE